MVAPVVDYTHPVALGSDIYFTRIVVFRERRVQGDAESTCSRLRGFKPYI